MVSDLRVIAGSAGGTRLYGAKSRKVRPVLDRVKESVFAALGDTVPGSRVLDLFAGIGSLGIEALSRGASSVDFMEQHRATASAITDNLARSRLGENARVHVVRLPEGLARATGNYGLIFVDPPFRIETRLMGTLFRRIHKRGLLGDGGLLLYRHSPRRGYEPPAGEWSLVERKDYGDSIISIYTVVDRTDGTWRKQ
jgi:16S rRNA (guanine966-N2)-methyltransferase